MNRELEKSREEEPLHHVDTSWSRCSYVVVYTCCIQQCM